MPAKRSETEEHRLLCKVSVCLRAGAKGQFTEGPEEAFGIDAHYLASGMVSICLHQIIL